MLLGIKLAGISLVEEFGVGGLVLYPLQPTACGFNTVDGATGFTLWVQDLGKTLCIRSQLFLQLFLASQQVKAISWVIPSPLQVTV